MSIDEAKVEVLKVWYSVFCTLIDNHASYSDTELMAKLRALRRELAERIPEVEEYMRRAKQ